MKIPHDEKPRTSRPGSETRSFQWWTATDDSLAAEDCLPAARRMES